MTILICGIVLFLLAIACHILIWKVRMPKNHTRTLFLIFLIFFCAGVLTMAGCGGIRASTVCDYARLALLYLALVLAYLITYSAIEVDSPSMYMISKIMESSSHGIGSDDMKRMMNSEMLVVPRINDLRQEGLVSARDGTYRLTFKGAIVAKIFVYYRALLGEKKGG